VAGGKLFGRPHIQDRDRAFACPIEHLLCRHRLQIVLRRQIEPNDALDLGQVHLAGLPVEKAAAIIAHACVCSLLIDDRVKLTRTSRA
jgi:hypothetical protein